MQNNNKEAPRLIIIKKALVIQIIYYNLFLSSIYKMIGGVKLHSFLYDAKKLLREVIFYFHTLQGCPRKVIR